jgi:DNA-binding HxlR family transcriptional regulator
MYSYKNGVDSIDETKENELIRLLGSKGTRGILQYLRNNGKAQYKDFSLSISPSTLNTRFSKLLGFGFIEHHFQRGSIREEWYEITEKGKRISECLEDLVRTIGE